LKNNFVSVAIFVLISFLYIYLWSVLHNKFISFFSKLYFLGSFFLSFITTLIKIKTVDFLKWKKFFLSFQ
jgi:hypothetical protein